MSARATIRFWLFSYLNYSDIEVRQLKCYGMILVCSLPPPLFFFFVVAFRIYDIDQDGYISNGELFQVLKTMVGSNLTEKQLQEIVDKTILYSDKDGDGKISYEEFCDVSWHACLLPLSCSTECKNKMLQLSLWIHPLVINCN